MITKIKNKINEIVSLWTNHIFRYSLSWSLILSGITFSFISMYFSRSESKEFISDIIIVFGVFLNPDFNVDKATKALHRFFRIIGSIIFLYWDLQLIKNDVLVNGSIFKYVLALVITIIILTYYIFWTYKIISTTFTKIKSNTNNISKFFKYTGVVIGFLISVATLLNIIIEILSSEN